MGVNDLAPLMTVIGTRVIGGQQRLTGISFTDSADFHQSIVILHQEAVRHFWVFV